MHSSAEAALGSDQSRISGELTDYVLLSDVHLGSDLVTHARPWSARTWLAEQAEIDQRLASMIEEHCEGAVRKIRFVVAGDFVDFIGMSLLPSESDRVRSQLTQEERAHGLGSASDHSALKVHAVARRHPLVFRAFARALAAGHALVIVPGNHDVEWHWRAAQRAFVAALCEHVPLDARNTVRRAVEFHPWFYYVPGLLYVEHGHEFDPMCSHGDPLLPVCPRDPRRIRVTVSDVLLRYVARPTRGLSTFGHEQADFFTYLRMASSFGLFEGLKLFARFSRASLRLFRETLTPLRRAPAMERRSAQRLRALGRRHRVCTEVLAKLKALHVRPVARSVRGLLRSLYWDRIGLGLLVMLTWAIFLASSPYRDALVWSLLFTACATVIGALSGRGRNIDPSERMQSAASEIGRRLDVRYVVMGHTHEPRFQRVSDGTCYVNLGNWGQDELPEDRHEGITAPPSSFLKLTYAHGDYHASLRVWDAQRGSRLLMSEPSGTQTVEVLEPVSDASLFGAT